MLGSARVKSSNVSVILIIICFDADVRIGITFAMRFSNITQSNIQTNPQ